MNEWIPLSWLLFLIHSLLLSGLLRLSRPCQSRRNSVTLLDESRLHLGWCNNAKQKCRWRQNYDVTVVSDISYTQMGPLRANHVWSVWLFSSSALVVVNNIIQSGKNNKHLIAYWLLTKYFLKHLKHMYFAFHQSPFLTSFGQYL